MCNWNWSKICDSFALFLCSLQALPARQAPHCGVHSHGQYLSLHGRGRGGSRIRWQLMRRWESEEKDRESAHNWVKLSHQTESCCIIAHWPRFEKCGTMGRLRITCLTKKSISYKRPTDPSWDVSGWLVSRAVWAFLVDSFRSYDMEAFEPDHRRPPSVPILNFTSVIAVSRDISAEFHKYRIGSKIKLMMRRDMIYDMWYMICVYCIYEE